MAIILPPPPKQASSDMEWQQWFEKLFRVVDKIAVLDGVIVNGGNGNGTSSTNIRRFTNIESEQGSAIDYADSSILGASFTIIEDGLYFISYTDRKNGAANEFAIGINSTEFTTSPDSIIPSTRKALINTAAGLFGTITTIQYLVADDVVRAHCAAAQDVTAQGVRFEIRRLA